MDDTIVRLDTWMEKNHPGYEEWNDGASNEQIDELEKVLRVKLPNSLRALLKWRAGEPCFIHNQYLMSCAEIAEHFEDMGGMADIDGWKDPNHWHKGWYAFSSDGGDCLVIDPHGSWGGVPGQVLEFDHEGDSEKTICAPGFDVWFETYVTALESGVFCVEDDMVQEVDEKSFDDLLARMAPGYPRIVEL